MSNSINLHPALTVEQVAGAGLETSASKSNDKRTRQADDRSRRNRHQPPSESEEQKPVAEAFPDEGLGMNVNMEV